MIRFPTTPEAFISDQEQLLGRKLAEKAIALYGRRIEVIFCNNDAMANGAWEAIDAAGRKTGKDC